MVNLDCVDKESHLQVVFSGALTIREAKKVFQFSHDLWHKQKPILIDLSRVTDLDTLGFQILLYLKVQAKARKCKLAFVGHSEAVLAALDLFGAVAEFGDKIKLNASLRGKYAFAYGIQRN